MPQINSKHLFFLIAGVTIVQIKTYPTIFIKNGGRDTWIALIVASFLICVYFVYLIFICRKKSNYDIVYIYKNALGKHIGIFCIILYCLNLFLNLIESTGVEASAMNINFIEYTPVWLILLFTIPAGVYIVKSGAAAVLTSVTIGIVFISTSGFILFLLTWSYKEFKRLLPILEDGLNQGFFISVIKLLGAYGGIAIMLPYLNDVVDKKKISKHCILAMIYVTQLQVISMTGTLTIFEVNQLNAMPYPKLVQCQLIRQFGYLEAGELFVMLQIIAGWFLKYILTLFAITKILERFKINKPIVLYAISIGLFIITYLISTDSSVLFLFLGYLIYISLANYIVIPFLVFTIFLVKKKN